MNFTRLVVYAFEIVKKKLEERLKEKKRVRTDDEHFSLGRSFGQDSSKILPKFSGGGGV